MKNIYEVWRNFNKNQESIKGPIAHSWLEHIQESSKQWESESYPKGEYWKYVKYGDLETTKLHVAQASQNTNNLSANSKEICIYLNDFSDITQLKSISLPEGIHIYSHKDVMDSEELSFKIKPLLEKMDKNNPLSEVSLTFLGLGLFIVVDKGICLDKNIKIIFDLNQFKSKDVLVPFSVQLLMEEGSSATLFLETRAEQFSGLSNVRFDSSLQQRAELNVYYKESGGNQSRTLNHNFMNVEEGAKLNFFDLTLPGQWSRHNTVASLANTHAEVHLNGVYLNNNDYFCDHHTEIRHLKENTTSHQSYKGILSDSARAVFNGKVFIEKMAKKSSSEQINKNLMLSKKAEIDTKPELEIYNDDVKAAHGATIGKIDEEQLFYLQSRGYSKSSAWRVLAKAFVNDSLENSNSDVKDFYENDMTAALEKFEDL